MNIYGVIGSSDPFGRPLIDLYILQRGAHGELKWFKYINWWSDIEDFNNMLDQALYLGDGEGEGYGITRPFDQEEFERAVPYRSVR